MLNPIRKTETLRLIRCDIADETYGLDMFWVRSIQRSDRLRLNPQTEGPSTGSGHGPSTSSGHGPSTSSGHGPSTSSGHGPSTSSGHGPVGWVPGSEGDIPVFSLASRLGRSSKESSASQRIIVLNPLLQAGSSPHSPHRWVGVEEGQPWALLVDRVSRVIQIPADHVTPLPPVVVNPSADYFQGVIKLDEEMILLLAPERLHPDASSPPLSSSPQAGGSEEGPQGERKEERMQAGESKGEAREAASPSPSTEPLTAGAGGQHRSYGQIVVFSIAKPHLVERALSFGLSISQVPEILEPLPMTPIPGAPAFVLGLVNWRDQPVPVIDLARRLGLAPEMNLPADERTCLIIARDKGHVLPIPSPVEGNSLKEESHPGALVGFPVRAAIQILYLPIAYQPCHQALPLDQTLTRGIVELENETLVVPDIRGILRQDGRSTDFT